MEKTAVTQIDPAAVLNIMRGIYQVHFKVINKPVKFDTACHRCGNVVEAGTGNLVRMTAQGSRFAESWTGRHDSCPDDIPTNTAVFCWIPLNGDETDPIHAPVFHKRPANKRAGKCAACGIKVEAGQGTLGKSPAGEFFTRHDGPCPH